MSCTDTQRIDLKRGATLSLAGTAALPSGTWTATCNAIGNSGKFKTMLDVALTDPISPATAHQVLVSKAAADTATWPEGDLTCDIRFEDASGVVIPTPSFVIAVHPWVPHG
jgi:hypothetical protein